MSDLDEPAGIDGPAGIDAGAASGPRIDPEDQPSRWGRWLGLAAVLAFIVMWIYVIPRGDSVKPEAWLNDRRFPTAAEPVCKAARAKLDKLPEAKDTRTAVERAAVIDQGTAILRTMQADLRPLVPAGGEREKYIQQWIDDWSISLRDRDDYAAGLRRDESTEFLETVKYGSQITKAIDGFAKDNNMASCTHPGDV